MIVYHSVTNVAKREGQPSASDSVLEFQCLQCHRPCLWYYRFEVYQLSHAGICELISGSHVCLMRCYAMCMQMLEQSMDITFRNRY